MLLIISKQKTAESKVQTVVTEKCLITLNLNFLNKVQELISFLVSGIFYLRIFLDVGERNFQLRNYYRVRCKQVNSCRFERKKVSLELD